MARVVISMQPPEAGNVIVSGWRRLRLSVAAAGAVVRALLGGSSELTTFDPQRFEDFVWRTLFSRTLGPDDFLPVTRRGFRVVRVPWVAAHAFALGTRRLGLGAVYPRLDTTGYDIMLAETPYPGRPARGTRLVVRYHDAIPVLMPHTISERARHEASHYHALKRNVEDGAWFACVSEASRRDLVSIFPRAEARSVTIPNMVSDRYFLEERDSSSVPGILLTRAHLSVEAEAASLRRLLPRTEFDPEVRPPSKLEYLLMVSTIEPRKNHLSLLAAWEQLRLTRPHLKLVLVGMLGWDCNPILSKMLPWAARGLVHVLEDVPADDLRLLYRHARVTVCPSFGEGFGYSGVEAMRCGGIVAASDLPVHREVYQEAAEYFNPYDVPDLARCLELLLGDGATDRRQSLQQEGLRVSDRYTPKNVYPQWEKFFKSLT